MTQTELVAMLRSRARKSGTQTSGYRGVSMLKQTGKWHAQINVGGKQARNPALLCCKVFARLCHGNSQTWLRAVLQGCQVAPQIDCSNICCTSLELLSKVLWRCLAVPAT